MLSPRYAHSGLRNLPYAWRENVLAGEFLWLGFLSLGTCSSDSTQHCSKFGLQAQCTQNQYIRYIVISWLCSRIHSLWPCRLSIDKREVLLACASSLTILGAARPALADEGYVNMEALKGKDYGKPAMR